MAANTYTFRHQNANNKREKIYKGTTIQTGNQLKDIPKRKALKMKINGARFSFSINPIRSNLMEILIMTYI
jgi:hypothetical protein